MQLKRVLAITEVAGASIPSVPDLLPEDKMLRHRTHAMEVGKRRARELAWTGKYSSAAAVEKALVAARVRGARTLFAQPAFCERIADICVEACRDAPPHELSAAANVDRLRSTSKPQPK